MKIITDPCMVCEKRSEVIVKREQYEAWQCGVLIQNAFPQLSADQRELLMTGTHPDCWDDMFGEATDDAL